MSEIPTKFPDSWGKLGEIPPSTPATLIGVGGFGEVYRWNKDGIQMAVKRIRVPGGCTIDIEREMNIVSQLRHKHIIQCYGVDRDANYVYIVTDYAEGGNLDDAAPRLDWMAKKRIVVEVALGLGYLHGEGIIHRDIKGGNIVLTKNDEAKLCDFGIAKVIASATCGSSFVRKGTPQFMAPELMRAKPAYSTMSDIYALGVVMQELVHKGEIPTDYMAIMKRCLNEDPEKRPTVKKIVGAFDVNYRIHVMDAKGDQVKTAQEPSADEDFNAGSKLYCERGDHVEAVEKFLRSASKGHTRAQYNLGFIYRQGVGVLRDFTKSVEWFQMAADKGFAPAQTELGKIYLGGMGTPQDYGRALDLFQAAANQDMNACKFLGWMYQAGMGAAQNNEEAMRWL
ncbi:hypothetical protein BGZ98_001731 [Dissophora globulifera]|nr:hypothetical protein BGZ98_001731 [Dissophora globulifera]